MAEDNSAASKQAQDLKERRLFAKFLSSGVVLIADPSGTSRTRLAHTLMELGAKQNGIVFASTYAEAAAAIETSRPRLILCEYMLGKISGLDLLQEQRKIRPESKKSIFALVTSNTSQSAVAAAAEEDVDTFIIKPYTLDSLKRTLIKAAIGKLYPSDYIVAIEAGKERLFKGDYDAALEIFDKAKAMDPKPALALFYHGQAEMMKKEMEAAGKDFKDGLTHNKIHYKCLIGLYELMMQRKDYKEAYQVVKKVAQYFPANPKRLASVLRLAIITESYEDIESYYRIFTMLEAREEELVRYVCSAMIVTGKFYLMGAHQSRGVDLLEKAAISAAGRPNFLRFIIETLVEYGKTTEAFAVLKRFPADLRSGADFLSMDLLVSCADSEPGVLIHKARNLIKQGVETAIIYEVLVSQLVKLGKAEMATDLVRVASTKWPEKKERFDGVLTAQPKNTPGKAAAPDKVV